MVFPRSVFLTPTFSPQGFLGTPFAFSKAGIAGGIIGFLIILAVVIYTTQLLIRCKEELRLQGVRVATLSDITRAIFGVRMDVLVTALVAVAQIGVKVQDGS
jgi:amino acid permease